MNRPSLLDLLPVIIADHHNTKHRRYSPCAPSGSTWLGDLPSHWSVRKLKFIATSRPSNVDKKSVEGEMPVRLCNYVDVYKNDFITPGIDFMVATVDPAELATFRLRRGDVLITKDSEEWSDIAVPAFVIQDFDDVACGYHLSLVRPHTNLIDGEFLFRAFRASGVAEQFHVAANGITRFGLSAGAIKDVTFPLPPLDEQRAISAFLRQQTARIDALVTKKQRTITLLQEKRTAIISHVVTKGLAPSALMKPSGLDWLGDIPHHWNLKKLKYLSKILRGKFTHRPRNDPRMYDGPYPFIQTGEIASSQKYVRDYRQTLSEEGLAVSKQFPKGTLVMSIAANIGDMAILDFEACFPDSIVGFVPKAGVDLDFLYHLFTAMKQPFMSTATLNTQLNLNIERIGSLTTVLPPLHEQHQIVKYLDAETDKFHRVAVRVNDAIIALREYRSALISAAVTGKIDVRKYGEGIQCQ